MPQIVAAHCSGVLCADVRANNAPPTPTRRTGARRPTTTTSPPSSSSPPPSSPSPPPRPPASRVTSAVPSNASTTPPLKRRARRGQVPRELFSPFVQSTLRTPVGGERRRAGGTSRRARAQIRYRLRGVVRHHGARAADGHYTATVRRGALADASSRDAPPPPPPPPPQVLVRKPATKSRPAAHEWFLFNDAVVEPMRADDVRRPPAATAARAGGACDARRPPQVLKATDSCYLLMYEAVAPAGERWWQTAVN